MDEEYYAKTCKEITRLSLKNKQLEKDLADTNEKLAKAKEIIREFYENTSGEAMTGLRGRAKNFLSEVKK